MRIIGLDLALVTEHTAIVMDERGLFLTPILRVHTNAEDLDKLFARAREGAAPGEPLVVVMEPTGMAWFPVAAFCERRAVTVYLVNSQQVADLRRYYQKHAKSDRIDARVLAKLFLISPEKLHPLHVASARHLACQRGCKELDRLMTQCVAIQNRVQAIDGFAWPGLDQVFKKALFSPHARWFRDHWYQPQAVLAAGAAALEHAWQTAPIESTASESAKDWAVQLVALAERALALYGREAQYLDYAAVHAEVQREQARLAELEEQHHTLQLETVRPLYRQLHPSRNLETLYGVGQDGAAVYVSFIADPQRFADHSHFRSWSGLIPNSHQSGDHEAKGLHITQAGPDLIKKFVYLGAETARQWDPQIAAIYYAQMVKGGKHHCQAVCACGTHLLDRILTIFQEDRPYVLRDVDGTAVTSEQAREIIAARYTVPKEVRERNNQRARRARAEKRAERKTQRESRPT
ncbi:MAG: IS110 family transposase [Planctomycetes bacterium]|nr:IS110 family transposase [Planctomycetota bacterium]